MSHSNVYRVGRKLGRTIYRDDTLIGIMGTPELGELVVAALNEQTARHEKEVRDDAELPFFPPAVGP